MISTNVTGTNLTGKLIAALFWLGVFSGMAAANAWLWRAAFGL